MMKLIQEVEYPLSHKTNWPANHAEKFFARQISSIVDLPESFQNVLIQQFLPDELAQWIIYAPCQAALGHNRSRRHFCIPPLPGEYLADSLLLLTGWRLLLVRIRQSGSCVIESILLNDLLYLRSGVALLLSWLEVCWVCQGTVRRELIYFNTVCDGLFKTLSEKIRVYLAGNSGLGLTEVENGKSLLSSLPFKFSNLIPQRLLLPQERVRRAILRPAIFQVLLVSMHRMIAPQMALVLTSHHLILASDPISDGEGDYGLMSTFLPLKRIRSAEVLVIECQVFLLIHLFRYGICEDQAVLFPMDMEPDLRCFVDMLNASL